MTSVKYYRDLLTQQTRIDAFRRALARVVKTGDRVLDLGTGLGTFAFFAADAGAAKVWGVDGEAIVHVAKAIGTLNGYCDRVEFIRGWLPEVTLPERVDVVIFEDFPPRLLGGTAFRLLKTVHEKYAAPGVRTVPTAAELYVAPVSSPELWREVAPFGAGDVAYDLDWSPSREYVANSPLNTGIPAEVLAGRPERVATLRFSEPPSPAALKGGASWVVERELVLHGLALWFDLDFGGGERLSNAPGAEPGSWGHLFLPVEPPLEVPASTEVRGAVRADPRSDGTPGWLAWEVVAGEERRGGHEFASAPASLGDVYTASPDCIPRLAARGVLEARVLSLTDGTRSIRDIARELTAERRDLTQEEAERLVARVLHDRIEPGPGLVAAGEG